MSTTARHLRAIVTLAENQLSTDAWIDSVGTLKAIVEVSLPYLRAALAEEERKAQEAVA